MISTINIPKKVKMLLLLTLLTLSFELLAQTEELDHYIQRFRYRPLELPRKNPALYELGFKLFYDKSISGAGNVSCQSCHSLKGFSGDGLPLALGEGAEGVGPARLQRSGLVIPRHTPAIYNVGVSELRSHFWDGRVAKTLQRGYITPEPKFNGPNPELKSIVDTFDSVTAMMSIFPFTSPEEMLGKNSRLTRLEAWDLVMKKIFEGTFKATYKRLFEKAYPGVKDYNIAHVGNALAELMRHHFAATNTLWDLYLRGRREVLSERMKRGAILFHTKAGCFNCHNRDQFSNFTFHNIGVPQIGKDDRGRYEVTKLESDMYEFRTPPLRNVGLTTPYMHSGVFKTLHEVVDHYDDPVTSLRNFQWNPRHPNFKDLLPLDRSTVNNTYKERTLSPMLARNLGLSDDEKDDLVCFLAVALTDIKLQTDLIQKGVVNEISDCSPRPY